MSRIANNLIKEKIDNINFFDVNPYLFYYFFPENEENTTNIKIDKSKSLRRFNSNFNIFTVLKEIQKRKEYILKLLESDCYQITQIKAKLTQNAIPGIGIESPYETGIRLHHIYGFPFIPSSEVKGSVFSYCKTFLNRDENDQQIIKILSSVIFFDAYPTLPLNGKLFKVDIVTPHYQPYYSGKNFYPGDWFSPNPLPFLTIRKGNEFIFHIASKDLNNLNTVRDWLKEVLQEVGIGAKTMIGFGHFKVNR